MIEIRFSPGRVRFRVLNGTVSVRAGRKPDRGRITAAADGTVFRRVAVAAGRRHAGNSGRPDRPGIRKVRKITAA